MNQGKLLIVGMGAGHYEDMPSSRGNVQDPTVPLRASSIFPYAYNYCDSRASTSKRNRLFTYQVIRSLTQGFNVVLVVPKVGMIDKRLRKIATYIQLPEVLNG